jgi:hypothetical protein
MPSTRRSAVVALAALVGLVVSLVALWPGPGPVDSSVGGPVPDPSRATTSAAPYAPGTRVTRSPTRPRPAATLATPASIAIAAIDLTARVAPVGVSRDGQMRLPDKPSVLGWYQFGSAPESRTGSVVIAGHLDSNTYGIGPLVRLRQLQPGQRITVTLANGKTRLYRVVELRRYDRQGLPDEVFSRSGPARLRIITCGGAYDAKSGGYQQNLVVTAVPA